MRHDRQDEDLRRLAALKPHFMMRAEQRTALEARLRETTQAEQPFQGEPVHTEMRRTGLHIAETVLAACLIIALGIGYFAVLRRLPRVEESGSIGSEQTTTDQTTSAAEESHRTTETEAATTSAAEQTSTQTDKIDLTTVSESTADHSTAPQVTELTTSVKQTEQTTVSTSVDRTAPSVTVPSDSETVSDLTTESTAANHSTDSDTTETETAVTPAATEEPPLSHSLNLRFNRVQGAPGETVHVQVTVVNPVDYVGVQMYLRYTGLPDGVSPVLSHPETDVLFDPSINVNSWTGANWNLSMVWTTPDGYDARLEAGTVLAEFDLRIPEEAAPGTLLLPETVGQSFLMCQSLTEQFPVQIIDAGAVTVTGSAP